MRNVDFKKQTSKDENIFYACRYDAVDIFFDLDVSYGKTEWEIFKNVDLAACSYSKMICSWMQNKTPNLTAKR